MELNEELREAEATGKLLLGSNETLDAVRSGKAQLVILSSTCPRDVEEDIRRNAAENEIPIFFYSGDSEDLGLVLGEPFLVSVLSVIEPGNSSIVDIGEVPDED